MTAAAQRVLCLCGSLRRVSSNRAALEAARQLVPATLELVLYDGLGRLPLFNPDDEAAAVPAPVRSLREAVDRADALLIACPEYAHGVPGAFKNLLDWLVGSLEFPGKPVLLLNTAARGSYHAQQALAEILRTMSAQLLAAQPLPVALPGAGCTAAQVLASAERRAELRAALDILADIPRPP
ncbi:MULTISPECIES: NADPH-dependent FMN reductase [Rhodanobacter]|uniref:NADPH-dependent FMN reductase n=1 Tax=Rhodanobacter TaxID=75309 RepID=UPI0004220D4A|nr:MULTISPECIES: NADPH-dependent FMN reductase [Rhodanobacter]KZC18638.1 FMN reductase [Rhodanobacter denitrificans]UJJ52362.1 NAD(P)H-dependent oxidoreductase [Rhodanobacter denitrificans]UJM95115.1 NAD(P)H-dependent oxidoreductase [Rhodanobacter denitrificans]UJM98646.1 NAD(P)H-dependent oxidoreductase [Rhodanobacter denitrificans]UJN21939.1 NAD(P)H-dependent oxidoreductase [Rhodanobacter denitrificans]